MPRKSDQIFKYTLGGGQWFAKQKPRGRILPEQLPDIIVFEDFTSKTNSKRRNDSAPTKPRKTVDDPKSLSIPLVIPETAEGLTRAIMLLGNAAQNALSDTKAAELAGLLGRFPRSDEIPAWKQYLKKLVKDFQG